MAVIPAKTGHRHTGQREYRRSIRHLLVLGVGIGPHIAAVTAALDLHVVRLLRAAMASADKGACGGPAGLRVHPQPRIDPRPVIHPTPRINPRPVVHPTPRIEGRLVHRPTNIEPPAPVAPIECETPRITQSPIQPPWKVLPWNQLPPPKPPLKVCVKPPDVVRTGTIFDAFA
jgi:hypothetical protein